VSLLSYLPSTSYIRTNKMVIGQVDIRSKRVDFWEKGNRMFYLPTARHGDLPIPRALQSSRGGDSQSLRSQPIGVEDGEVRDFTAEEEEQAEEDGDAERLHQEILRARADPAPEYRPRSPNLPGFDEL
jgi:hypothetical protein